MKLKDISNKFSTGLIRCNHMYCVDCFKKYITLKID